MLRTLPSVSHHPRPVEAPATGEAELAPFVSIPKPRTKRIMSFDIENRPLSYWYDGNCTAEITAIAWGAEGERVECYALGESAHRSTTDAGEMLRAFVRAYNEADILTGHYIRKHDLPIINGALVEHGMAPLRPKLTSDTRLDLIRWKDLPASQEALGDMLGLDSPKEHMSQAKWREANRLTPQGIAETRRRVIGDVRQHLELRSALLERGLLRAPRWWRP